jgi:phospholipid transport system substrate-binding protein
MKARAWVLLVLCFVCPLAFAQSSPVAMLQQTSNQLLRELKQNRGQLRQNPGYVRTLVRRVIVPHFDLVTMSRSVMGRDAWMRATPAQRQRFIREFTQLAIRTYSAALSAYSDQEVEFYPLRNSGSDGRVQVESKILQNDGPSTPVSYRLVLSGSQWKVYDFSVEGVSMVQSFRSQFSDDLSSGNIDRLNNRIASHNRGGE